MNATGRPDRTKRGPTVIPISIAAKEEVAEVSLVLDSVREYEFLALGWNHADIHNLVTRQRRNGSGNRRRFGSAPRRAGGGSGEPGLVVDGGVLAPRRLRRRQREELRHGLRRAVAKAGFIAFLDSKHLRYSWIQSPRIAHGTKF